MTKDRQWRKQLAGLLLSVLALLFVYLPAGLAADFSKLVILHTNDTHGFDIQSDGIYGMAAVAALKKDFEAKGYDVLLLDAGDAIQDNNLVNYSKGRSAIAMMNAARYDAMTLGNHEFDYGQDVLLQRVKEAKFPVVSCNVLVDAWNRPLVRETAVFRKGGVRIGVIGMTTPSTDTSTNPKNVEGLTFLSGQALFDKVQGLADGLKGQGCDLVIALGHMGSEEGNEGNRSDDVLQHVTGLDIFIDGHDHSVKNRYIGKALLAETGSYTHNIGVIRWQEDRWTEKFSPAVTFTGQDKEVLRIANKYNAEVQKAMGRQAGTAPFLLDGSRDPGVRTRETNLGDFVADAFLWQARTALKPYGLDVDGAIVNGGGLRKSIPAGPVTVGSVTAVLPYNNQLFLMKLKGAVLLEILEAGYSTAPAANGAFPQLAGIKVTVRTGVPYEKGRQYPNSTYFAPAKPGSRVTVEEINGKPFDPDKEYVLAAPEFLRRGGDTYGALAEEGAAEIRGTGYIDTDAVLNFLAELGGTVGEPYAEPAGRVRLVE